MNLEETLDKIAELSREDLLRRLHDSELGSNWRHESLNDTAH
jgi:hypothetical protein